MVKREVPYYAYPGGPLLRMVTVDGPDSIAALYESGQAPWHEATERLAKDFHDTYERLAPEYSYVTREASAVPWEDVPEQNKRLMIAVAAEIRSRWLLGG